MDPRSSKPDSRPTVAREPGDTNPADATAPHLPGAAADAFLAPPERPDELGRIGPYRVLGELGRGGMGVVYHAEDPRLQRAVAIKVLLPNLSADPQAKARFVREARAQAKVEHDHVIPIHEVEEANGVAYIAMPLLKGQTLGAALKADPRPPLPELARIGREMAEGLAAAHAAGLIHRDIKPGNVWLEGAKRRVRILDFGLARGAEAAPEADAAVTASGAIMGTPAYMSPEQARGQSVDTRSDLFSLGVVLYEMATGRRPFTGESAFDVMAAVVSYDSPPAQAISPDLPPALSNLIHRLMAKDPAARSQSAEAVAEELEAIGSGLVAYPVRVTPLAAVPGMSAAPDPWADIETTQVDEEDENATERKATAAPRTHRVQQVAARNWLWPAVALGFLVCAIALAWAVWPPAAKPPERAAPAPEPLKPRPAPAKEKDKPLREPRLIALPTSLHCVAVSPNGNWIATASEEDGTVYLIARETGEIREQFTGHSGRVLSVAFSPDGEWLASGGGDATVRLWNLKGGEHRILGRSSGAVWAIGFFADGTRVAAAGSSVGWDIAGGEPLPFEHMLANGLAQLPGADRIASVYFGDNNVRVFDAKTGKQVAFLGGVPAPRAVAAAPDGKRLAIALGMGGDPLNPPVAGADFTVRVWDSVADKTLHTLKGHEHVAFHVAWAPVGGRIASAGYDKTVRVWDAETGAGLHVLKHDGPVFGVAFGPDGRTLVSAGRDRTVRIWELPPR